MCQEHTAELYEKCPFARRVIGINWRRFQRDASYRIEISEMLRSLKSDLSLNSVYSRNAFGDFLCTETRAPHRVGFEGDFCNLSGIQRRKFSRSYTTLIADTSAVRLEMDRHRRFLEEIGIEASELKLVVWTTREDESFAGRVFDKHRLPSNATVAVFPGAQRGYRIYPRFPEVLSLLPGLRFVLLGGADSMNVARRIESEVPDCCVNLAGRTSLRQMAAVIRRCRLLIGSESCGPHVACAVGVPNVVVVGGGHFGRFFPYSSLTTAVFHRLPCYGCNWMCRLARFECIEDIPWAKVVAAAEEVLGSACRETDE